MMLYIYPRLAIVSNIVLPYTPFLYPIVMQGRCVLKCFLGQRTCPCSALANSLPKIPLQLHKIPVSIREIGDEGFKRISCDFPSLMTS